MKQTKAKDKAIKFLKVNGWTEDAKYQHGENGGMYRDIMEAIDIALEEQAKQIFEDVILACKDCCILTPKFDKVREKYLRGKK